MHLSKPRYPRFPDTAPRARKLLIIEDRIFTEPRIRVYACVLAVAWAFIVGWLLSGGWITLSCSIDFCWEWVTGVLAVKDPARVYDVGRFVGWPEGRFPYPPPLILFLYPLGWMPYAIAFAVWIIATPPPLRSGHFRDPASDGSGRRRSHAGYRSWEYPGRT